MPAMCVPLRSNMSGVEKLSVAVSFSTSFHRMLSDSMEIFITYVYGWAHAPENRETRKRGMFLRLTGTASYHILAHSDVQHFYSYENIFLLVLSEDYN